MTVSRHRGVLRTRGVGWDHIGAHEGTRQSLPAPTATCAPHPPIGHAVAPSFLDELADGPDGARQFASDRGERLVHANACAEVPIARMQPQLGATGEFDDFGWQIHLALLRLPAMRGA